jgi:hypothetical protein
MIMNHDALFKMLLKAPSLLKGFFEAFVPDAFPFVDFGILEFVDKERFTIDGRKRTGDLLVKTRFRGEAAGFLIHLEHQAQPDSDLGRRMLEYFMLDWRQYDLPVYPIAVLSYKHTPEANFPPLSVSFPNKRVLQFDFDVIDLSKMEAERYIKMPNPAALALAARMKFDTKNRISLTRDFYLALAATPLQQREQKLVACFFSAYQPLDKSQALQLAKELGKVKPDARREKIMHLTNPFIELGKEEGLQQGLQRGRQEGRQEGETDLVLRLLCRRIGALSASQKKVIRKLSAGKIEALGEALLDFTSPADLTRWLGSHREGAKSSK